MHSNDIHLVINKQTMFLNFIQLVHYPYIRIYMDTATSYQICFNIKLQLIFSIAFTHLSANVTVPCTTYHEIIEAVSCNKCSK